MLNRPISEKYNVVGMFCSENYGDLLHMTWGHTVAYLAEVLRYKPAGRGFVSEGVIGIFHWHNPSGRNKGLGLTQPLTESSARNIFFGIKAAGASIWQPYHLRFPIVSKRGSLTLLEPSGPVTGLYKYCFTFTFTSYDIVLKSANLQFMLISLIDLGVRKRNWK
jgi:hypothetical protein